MSKYIYFTPEEKARAQNTDLVSLLRAQGERPVRSGREFRTPNDPSITVRGNKWFDHSKREGGYAVSFAQRYYRLPYQEAVLLLLGRKNGKSYEQAKPAKEAPKPFALPEPYGTMRVCMLTSCVSATLTGRSSPIRTRKAALRGQAPQLRFRGAGWQRRGETRPYPQHQQRRPGVPHEH